MKRSEHPHCAARWALTDNARCLEGAEQLLPLASFVQLAQPLICYCLHALGTIILLRHAQGHVAGRRRR